jgi:hypothetical protein
MLVGIYLAFWILVIVASGVVFAAGIISEMSLAMIGFASASLVFVGLIGLLPWSVDNYYSRFSEVKRIVLPSTIVYFDDIASGARKDV